MKVNMESERKEAVRNALGLNTEFDTAAVAEKLGVPASERERIERYVRRVVTKMINGDGVRPRSPKELQARYCIVVSHELHKELKTAASEEDCTMRALGEEILWTWIRRRKQK